MIHKKIPRKKFSLAKNLWTLATLSIASASVIMIFMAPTPAEAAGKKKAEKNENEESISEESSETVSTVERHKIPTDLDESLKQDKKLSSQLSQLGPKYRHQITWLKTTSSEEFLALFNRNIKQPSLGIVIILPNPGEHANWQGIIQNLSQALPKDGWSTLSFSIPKYTLARDPMLNRKTTPTKVPDQTEDTSQNSNQDPASEVIVIPELPDAFPEWEKNIMDRLDASLKFAQNFSPKKIVILSSGLTGNPIAASLKESQISPDGLIFNNWNFYSTDEKSTQINSPEAIKTQAIKTDIQIDPKLESVIQAKIPILELTTPYKRNPASSSLKQAKARQTEGKIASHPDYLVMKTLDSSSQRLTSQWMINRIRGWLRKRYDPAVKTN